MTNTPHSRALDAAYWYRPAWVPPNLIEQCIKAYLQTLLNDPEMAEKSVLRIMQAGYNPFTALGIFKEALRAIMEGV